MEETAPQGVPSSDRTLALLTHLSGIFFWFLPPLIVYFVKKDDSPWVRRHAAAALNFQLTLLIGMLIGVVLAFVLIGFLLMWLIGIANLVLSIVAAIKANDGADYSYPLAIRFVR